VWGGGWGGGVWVCVGVCSNLPVWLLCLSVHMSVCFQLHLFGKWLYVIAAWEGEGGGGEGGSTSGLLRSSSCHLTEKNKLRFVQMILKLFLSFYGLTILFCCWLLRYCTVHFSHTSYTTVHHGNYSSSTPLRLRPMTLKTCGEPSFTNDAQSPSVVLDHVCFLPATYGNEIHHNIAITSN